MFQDTIISNADMTNLKLSDGAYRCYTLLLSHAYGKKTSCFPSQIRLATMLGRTVRSIQRYIKELKKLGLIVVKRAGRKGCNNNLYSLVQKQVKLAMIQAKNAQKKVENESNKENITKKTKSKKPTYNQYKRKTNNFNSYEQRKYNFNNVEAMFRGEMEYDPANLYDKEG